MLKNVYLSLHFMLFSAAVQTLSQASGSVPLAVIQ